jgi:predicted aldo/keto reductase-like oxidoreductase
LTRKHQALYAIDYNKELNKELNKRAQEYEDILGIETVIDSENRDWDSIQKERERFFRFMGFNAWL